MKRYVLTCATSASAFNAGSKAPSDVNRILASDGCVVIRNKYMLRHRLFRLPMVLVTPVTLALKIRRGSQLIFQHPYDTAHDAIRFMNRILLLLLRFKHVSTAVVVHDIESKRFTGRDVGKEVRLLNRFDLVVVHSPKMCEFLTDKGLTSECRILGLFDYLVSKTNTMPREKDGGVCFAGNLDKSVFVSHIAEAGALEFHLYGSAPSSLPQATNVTYEGRFAPDDLSSLKGGWGLVWDGDAIDRCSGVLGEYLSMNSPHKASMYVCAGLPLIVPAWSAAADIVRQWRLGIVISSLKDIEGHIGRVTDEEYASIKESVAVYAKTMMEGGHLLAALSPQLFHVQ